MEADLLRGEGVPFRAIPAAGVHGVGLRLLPGNLLRLVRGFFAARRILRAFRPDVLLFTGGYVAVPMALAAHFFRPKGKNRSLLYVPDIEPGLALKALSHLADGIAVTVEESRTFFPGRAPVTVTGYPLRPVLQEVRQQPKADALKVFGLRENLPVLLVMGGSKGSRSINRAVSAALPTWLAEMQVLHLVGKLDWAEIEQRRAALSPNQAANYRPYAYLGQARDMGAALRVADLVVARAGASTLGELPLFGLPAILVPYPFAWRYQRVNANYLAQRGAAEILEDASLEQALASKVLALMRDSVRREQMSKAMQALAQPQAAVRIAALLLDLSAHSEGSRM